jgi:hypothetical protein
MPGAKPGHGSGDWLSAGVQMKGVLVRSHCNVCVPRPDFFGGSRSLIHSSYSDTVAGSDRATSF